MKQNAFICDIDGTVALHMNPDGTNRRGHYEYEKVSEDLPNPVAIKVVQNLWLWDQEVEAREDVIVPLFVTGRTDCNEGQVRHDTLNWLTNNFPIGMVSDDRLLMRNEFFQGGHDYRPDYIIKEEIYDEKIEPFYNVLYCWDDRLQVISMYRGKGLTVFDVAGNTF
jgi:hypothetical protein